MRSIHKYPVNKRDPEKRFWSLVRRSAARPLSFGIIGIVFVTSPDFVFASDSSQTPPARFGLSTQVSTLAYETARLPISDLNLILTGTITGTPGRALISVEGRKEELFSVGQAITSGVFLTDVYPRGAVVSRYGVLEKLELRSRAKSQDFARFESDPPSVPNQFLPDEANRGQGNNSYSIKRTYANKLFEAPDLLAHAKIIPVPNGGIQISDIIPGSLFERLGLNDGDAIRTINGAPVNSISDFVNIFQQRNNTDKLQLGVARGGNLYNMQFDSEHGIEIEMVSEFVK